MVTTLLYVRGQGAMTVSQTFWLLGPSTPYRHTCRTTVPILHTPPLPLASGDGSIQTQYQTGSTAASSSSELQYHINEGHSRTNERDRLALN